MKYSYESNSKLIAALLTAGFVISIISGIYYYKNGKTLDKEKNQISLTADSLNVVKNKLQNEVSTLTEQLADEKVNIEEMATTLANKEKIIASKQSLINQSINRLSMIEKNDKTEISSLESQVKELRDLKGVLERRIVSYSEKSLLQNKDNMALNEKILLLQKEVLDLKSNVKEIKYLATADNFSVELLKPNSKLTTKAKKVRTLRISMRIPAFLKTESTENTPVYISITDNKNNAISGTIKEVSLKDEENKELKIAIHQLKMIDFNKNPQRLSFDYKVTEDLKPGIYSAKVYSTDTYLGTVEFRVKDSFWFF
jgi:chromosome segregation ATPase